MHAATQTPTIALCINGVAIPDEERAGRRKASVPPVRRVNDDAGFEFENTSLKQLIRERESGQC